MTYDELTKKQQKVVDADAKLRSEQDEKPTAEDVANEAYDTCGSGMVWYVRNKYSDIIMDRTEESVETYEKVNITDMVRIMQGEPLVDGDYRLSYNDDGDERWYLRYDDGEIHHAVGFNSVTYDGRLEFYSGDSYSLTVDDLDDSAPRVYEVLTALASES